MGTNGYAGPGAPVPCKPSHATAHVERELIVPDGRRAIDIEPDELREIVMKLGIPGVDNDTGYSRVLELYAAHLQAIRDKGGNDAVCVFLGVSGVIG